MVYDASISYPSIRDEGMPLAGDTLRSERQMIRLTSTLTFPQSSYISFYNRAYNNVYVCMKFCVMWVLIVGIPAK